MARFADHLLEVWDSTPADVLLGCVGPDEALLEVSCGEIDVSGLMADWSGLGVVIRLSGSRMLTLEGVWDEISAAFR